MFSERSVPRAASPSLNLTRRVCLQITAGWPGSGSSVVISWHGDACHIFIRRVPAPPCYHGHHSLSVNKRARRSTALGSYWLYARSGRQSACGQIFLCLIHKTLTVSRSVSSNSCIEKLKNYNRFICFQSDTTIFIIIITNCS
jgi:hypothetical protein